MSNKYNPNLISALQAFSYSDFIRTDEPNNPIQKNMKKAMLGG